MWSSFFNGAGNRAVLAVSLVFLGSLFAVSKPAYSQEPGVPTSPVEWRVSPNDPNFPVEPAGVAIDADGLFVVTWSQQGHFNPDNESDVLIRYYHVDATPHSAALALSGDQDIGSQINHQHPSLSMSLMFPTRSGRRETRE